MKTRLGRRGLVGGVVAMTASLSVPRFARAASAMGFDDARHLLSRTSFGVTPAEIRTIEPLDYGDAVDRLLNHYNPRAATPDPRWINETPSALRERRQAGAEGAGTKTADGKPVNPANQLVREEARELRNWWVDEMLATDQPLIEKMTLFWHSHFTSSVQKVRYVPSLYRQNVLFRREALGNFGRLLKAVARDPAMLLYLDGVRSVASQPNENFARELLELFTLGEGHYDETDIRNAARAFTGWSIDRDTGQFVDRLQQHDGGSKTFLGQTGNFDGGDIISIVLRQPRTAETVVEKLWREFVSMTPDPAEVTRLAAVFRNANYEMKPLLRAIFLSPAFRDPANRAALIKSPVELIVGTVHVLDISVPDSTQLVRMMGALGQSPFDPPNVKGWPGGESWITTNTLLLREQFLRRIVEASTVSSMDSNIAASAPRAEPRHRMPDDQGSGQAMEQFPVEGRSVRDAAGEAKLGPALSGIDGSTLMRTLLPQKPIDAVHISGQPPGVIVAAALLDPAYQLK